ncbi:hypothetical protein ACKAV7_003955 [Fusarium commune]|nr:hypothetical protein LZL87_008374 [Fusarium oxysporum]
MKPVAILLALASTACTVSAGLPRYVQFQLLRPYETCGLRRSRQLPCVCYGASVDSPCSNDWECNSNHCKGTALTTPYEIFTNASQEEDAMTAVILAT